MKNNILKLIICFCIVLSSILSIIDYHCFDNNFYKKEYSKLNTAEDVGVSEDDLFLMTDDLLDYLKGDKEDLSLIVTVNGEKREAFNQRETIHMADVKDLYDKVIIVKNISFLVAIIVSIYLAIKKEFNNFTESYIKVLISFLIIFGIIGLLCLIDFDFFWTNFHLIFFTKNDYWLLDPKTSLLINMVPSQFFFDLCIRIIITVFVVLSLYYLITKYGDKKVIKND